MTAQRQIIQVAQSGTPSLVGTIICNVVTPPVISDLCSAITASAAFQIASVVKVVGNPVNCLEIGLTWNVSFYAKEIACAVEE